MAEVINPHLNPLPAFVETFGVRDFTSPHFRPTPTISGPLLDGPTLSSREIDIQFACKKLAEILIKKNRDYGSGNIARHGQKGILVRIDDKTARIENLLDNPSKVNCESIDDNWLDIAGYAILGYIIAE